MSKYIQFLDWRKLITEIIEREPDPDVNWTHASLGAAIGTSRSTIGRMLMDPSDKQFLKDPKHSQGMALVHIHAEIREKIAAQEAESGTNTKT